MKSKIAETEGAIRHKSYKWHESQISATVLTAQRTKTDVLKLLHFIRDQTLFSQTTEVLVPEIYGGQWSLPRMLNSVLWRNVSHLHWSPRFQAPRRHTRHPVTTCTVLTTAFPVGEIKGTILPNGQAWRKISRKYYNNGAVLHCHNQAWKIPVTNTRPEIGEKIVMHSGTKLEL